MRIAMVAAVLAAALAVAGCNTVEGMGRDVSSVGKTVSDAAK
jgi:predicted small secreted protein